MKQFTEQFAKTFKRPYAYKMGGTQIVVMPNGQEFKFDDREYYRGRGAKYNASIRHDDKGRIVIPQSEVTAQLRLEREYKKRCQEAARLRAEAEKRYKANKAAGVYGLTDGIIELSPEESYKHTFDPERLAKTLDISVGDARLLFSTGKTYVFAKTSDGRTLELYHADLECNSLSIFVEEVTPEHVATFNHDKWAAAPYSEEVGMTDAPNHFVC